MGTWGVLANRRTVLIVGAIVATAVALGLGTWALTRGDAPGAPEASAGPGGTAPTVTASAASPLPEAGLRLGEIIATSAVEELDVFAAPDGAVTHTLGPWSLATFQPLTLLAIDDTMAGEDRWLQVLVPAQPNQTTGWIRAEDVTITSSDITINIYVAERELELLDGETVILTASVAVGTDETPTP